uniref:Ribosomal protein S2 n=1 Tax=Babesia rodhaini TaxID=5870 RepID=A0A455R267_BABRO|nr:ribosomal protein S2 [Babesia rodhaini]
MKINNKTILIKNLLKKGLHYKIQKNNYIYKKNNEFNLKLQNIILNIYTFYKIIYNLKLKKIKFLFIYTVKNKSIKNIVKKISILTSNYYLTTSIKGGIFTNKKYIKKKIFLIKSIIFFKKFLYNKYKKFKNRKLLRLIFNLKSQLYRSFSYTYHLLNKSIFNINFLIFLSPKKDIKFIKESSYNQKIIITLNNKKLYFSDLTIINNYDKINKQKLIFYLLLFYSI